MYSNCILEALILEVTVLYHFFVIYGVAFVNVGYAYKLYALGHNLGGFLRLNIWINIRTEACKKR
jgi:hypothetical protein